MKGVAWTPNKTINLHFIGRYLSVEKHADVTHFDFQYIPTDASSPVITCEVEEMQGYFHR